MGTEVIRFNNRTLFFDIETHTITERIKLSPREYFRLGGFAWGESDEITITEDYDEMIDAIERAQIIIGHNIHNFDLSVLYGKDSFRPVELAQQRRVFDTIQHAIIAAPAPVTGWFLPKGAEKMQKCEKPGEARKWYKLDNLAHQLGVEGKLMDLNDLAKKYTFREEPTYSPKTGKKLKAVKRVPIEGICCGFGAIPTDDPDFREYLRWDVVAARNVARALLERMPMDEYAWRVQEDAALDAQIHRNGFRTDTELIEERIFLQNEEAAWTLNELNDRFKLPLHKKKPLATKEGKEALEGALVAAGVDLEDLEKTKNGAYSFGGDSVIAAAQEAGTPEALKLAAAVATLAGQRSLAELAKESTYEDGFVHPDIMPLQRSGRKSTTNPGLTIYDQNHKDEYLPDNDDHVLVSFDFSNADARAVAAMSGDKEFAKRFEPGQDGHLLNAIAAWGRDVVLETPETKVTYRTKAKGPGHAWSYRVGPGKLMKVMGVPFREAKKFLDNLNKAYPLVVKWQDACVAYAEKHGYVVNDWGRKMPVDPRRAYTQSPALMGQSTTNEVLTDGKIKLARMFPEIFRMMKVTIHDEIIMSIPRDRVVEICEIVVRCFTKTWKPRVGGQAIEFTLSYGKPGKNWKEATHD